MLEEMTSCASDSFLDDVGLFEMPEDVDFPEYHASELASLRVAIADKDRLLAQQNEIIKSLKSKLEASTVHASKLEAAVEHRDSVISQLATSRKLVFEECHRTCVSNQAELRQMQEALHRVTRQLHRERREHAAHQRELRRLAKISSTGRPPAVDVVNNETVSALTSEDSMDSPPGTPDSSVEELLKTLEVAQLRPGARSPDTLDEYVDYLTW
jgi:hypothetical protein